METMTHSQLVAALCKSGEQILQESTPLSLHILHMAVGISGEAGELLDAIKKVSIYSKPPDIENIIEELGDLEFFMEGLRQAFRVTREECLNHNIKKLTKRYSSLTYTNTHAQERKDKC